MRFEPGSRDVECEVALLDSLIVSEERDPLRGLVAELQAAQNPGEFYDLHGGLLRRFYARQKVTDELREEIAVTKAELAKLTADRPVNRNKVIPVQGLLVRQQLAERSCKAVLHTLRCVGDGIAWKALRYDRAAICVLGEGRRVGRLTDPAGLDAELAMSAHWWQHGSFAIHNDLTNCLRTGDLTLPFEAGNSVGIQEVKAGRIRPGAQDRAIKRRLEFLARGSGQMMMGAADARLARYPVPLRTHLHALQSALSEARLNGYASVQPAPSLLLVAVDPRISLGEPGIDVVEQAARRDAGWEHEPRLIRTVSMVRRMRERLHHYPYLAPLTIFPLFPQDVAELLLGPLEYVTILNVPVLEKEFEQAGIDVHVADGVEANRRFLRAESGNGTVELPALVREQMLTELLHSMALVECVSLMLNDVNNGALGSTLVSFADEARTWAPA